MKNMTNNTMYTVQGLHISHNHSKYYYKLRWCPARDLFGSQIPVTTRGFELQISFARSNYLTH